MPQLPRAAALHPATWVVLLMVFGTVAEATRRCGLVHQLSHGQDKRRWRCVGDGLQSGQ